MFDTDRLLYRSYINVVAPAHIVWPFMPEPSVQLKQWVRVKCISLYTFTFVVVVNCMFPHWSVSVMQAGIYGHGWTATLRSLKTHALRVCGHWLAWLKLHVTA